MSLKYRDKNGAEHVLAGLTPGGDIEYGAVATRSGTITVPELGVSGSTMISVTFSEAMPDNDYIVDIDLADPAQSGYGIPYTIGTRDRTVNGFNVPVVNSTSGQVGSRKLKWIAYKLYTVADAEVLYSSVQDIKDMIPSNASSTNKFATADDLRTDVRGLDRRLDDVEDCVPSSASISNQLVTNSDLQNVTIDKLGEIQDVDVSGVTDGQTIVYDDASQKWVNGQGGKVYSAGDGISISNTDEISAKVDDTSITTDSNDALKVADSYKTAFVGTKSEWDALTTEQKKNYKIANITDDVIGGEVADAVTDGDMRPVTSNAVYDYPINSITDGEHRPPTSDAVYDAFALLRTWVDVTSSAVTITGSTFDRNTIKVYSNGDECIICGEYTDTTNPESAQDGWINGLVHLKVNENYCPRYETALFGFNNRDNHSPVIYYLSTNGKIQGYTGNGTGAGVMDRVPVNGRWIINK